MKVLSGVVFASFFNIIGRLFRPAQRPPAPEAETPTEIFENDARETVREIEEHVPPTAEPPRQESEILAPNGICLHKSVRFRTRSGDFRSAKVMSYSWEDEGHFLVLSRNNGPLFKRRLC